MDLINRILSKPCLFRWSFGLIRADASLKFLKSLAFAPCMGYSSKKGIILSTISENFYTVNLAMLEFSATEKEPPPKNCTKLSIK